ADSLVGDTTGSVLLQVGLVDNYKKKELPLDHLKVIESNDCFMGNFVSEKSKYKSFEIEEPIIIAWDAKIHHISSEPKMPTLLTIWLQPKNYIGEYTIDWELEVKWMSNEQVPAKVFKHIFHNTKTANSPDGTDLPLPDDDETIVGGDEITISGKYYDQRNSGYNFKKKLTGMKILGTNDENNVQVVNSYINGHEFPTIDLPLSEQVSLEDQRKQMRIIVEKESSHFQFFDTRYTYKPHGPNDVGYPNTQRNAGKAADWGLCQLNDWEPSLGVIWNWKTNINAGIHLLWGTDSQFHKYAQVKKKFARLKEEFTENGKVPRDPNRKEFLLMLAQRYKRGFYFTGYEHGNSKGEKGHYVKTKNEKWFEYGDDFCIRFGLNCTD
ncbi:MAG TPA: hypothetical protein PK665_14670, partial [Ignavibacteriaceae bacterium]|nr:hypothetical protein [Ignavibacteriaceae bacterium]